MEYNFDTKDIVQASFILQIDLDALIKASKKIGMVNPYEFDAMDALFTDKWSFGEGGMYRTGDTCVYITDVPPMLPDIIFMLGYSFLMDYPNFEYNVGILRNRVDNIRSILTAISSDEESIRAYGDRIAVRRNQLYNIPKFNMADPTVILPKACRKLGIKYKYIDHEHHFLFKNVKSGNDVEGYIKYREIDLICKEDLRIKEVVYNFNNFSYRSSWGLDLIGYLHPHISATNAGMATICFGNRDSDAKLYRSSGAYEFFALLLKESVYNYDPSNPYEKVSSIIPKIMVLEKIASLHKVLDEDGNMITNATHPEEYAKLLLTHLKKCEVCNQYLLPNPEHPEQDSACISEGCAANPNAIRNCTNCGHIMTRGVWDASSARYLWECHNEECEVSVEAIAHREMRNQRRGEIEALINAHFETTKFVGRNGRSRMVLLLDGDYVLCPVCGEPLSWENKYIRCYANRTSHNGRIIYLQADNSGYDELINSEYPVTTLPESAELYRVYIDNDIAGEIIANLWLQTDHLKEDGSLYTMGDIAFMSLYGIDRITGNEIFSYGEVYGSSLRAGSPRNFYLDEYFKAHSTNITL